MEPVLRNLLFCDSVVPLPHGRLVAYGIFTDLHAAAFPLCWPRFSLLLSWTNAPGFHIQMVKMLNPQRSLILHQSPESYFTLGDDTECAHVILDIHQAVFTEPGSYHFSVALDGRTVAEYPLHVRLDPKRAETAWQPA